MRAKNEDYGADGPFDNFVLAEALKICSAEEGIVLRMGDKLSRLSSVLKKGAQVPESFRDTVLDIINYAVLFLALVEDKADL